MIVDNKNFHKKLPAIPLHGDPIEKNHTPTFGSLARKKPAEDWLPKPSNAVVCCNCNHLTVGHRKSECGPRESWDSESPSPMRNGEMSMMCLTDVKLMPRFVRYLDHRT